MRTKNRVFALVLAVIVLATVFSGCKKEETSATPQEAPASSTATSKDSEAKEEPSSQEPVTLSWYQVNRSNSVAKSMDEVLAFQELAKLANVEIKFEHPAAGMDNNEQINLLIASQQLPDIIFWNWKSMPGGIAKYVKEEIILPLNDLDTPYYDAAMEEYPECAVFVPLDDGTIPAFYQMDPDPRRTTYSGFCMRTDWLDQLELEVPVTLDDWYTVLTAFKTGDPNGNGQADELPYLDEKGNNLKPFAAAFGLLAEIGLDPTTGEVIYGPVQPGYKDFLTTMNKWYEEGLIDPEFATNDRKMFTAKIQSERAGAYYASINVGVGNNLSAVRPTNPDFTVVGIPAPESTDGTAYMPKSDSLMKLGEASVITSSCKNPQAAANLIDLGYSEEGRTLLNWGVEGVTYEIRDGEKHFTEAMMNPGDNMTPSTAITKYTYPSNGNSKVMDFAAAAEIQYIFQESYDSIDNWMLADTSLMLHPNMAYLPEESARISTILSEVSTYHDEMALKFIIGTESLDNFDAYVEQIKKMNIDEAVELTQNAVDRLHQRVK